MARWRRLYGAGPFHLAGFLLFLVVSALAIRRFFDNDAPETLKIFIWLAGAIVGHDLVLLPLYSLADRILTARVPRNPGATRVAFARSRNHLRVPVVLSGLLLFVFFPLILRHSPGVYRDATSLSPGAYLQRWLLVSAGLFAVSAAVLAIRLLLARRRRSRDP